MIIHYREINEYLLATGFEQPSELADFFVLSFDEITDSSVEFMPPYQKDFYQITLLISGVSDTSIEIDTERVDHLENSLFFLSPTHVYAWRRSGATKGYIVYFKREFLDFYQGALQTDFPFFDITNQGILSLSDTEVAQLTLDFQKLHREYHSPSLYRYQILQSSLLAFLFKIKSLDELAQQKLPVLSRKQELFAKFKSLLQHRIQADTQVTIYASYLGISESYLNSITKAIAMITAKEYIAQYRLKLAKSALKYSSRTIAEVGYCIGFEEPTHFSRFFKKYEGVTPSAYRKKYT